MLSTRSEIHSWEAELYLHKYFEVVLCYLGRISEHHLSTQAPRMQQYPYAVHEGQLQSKDVPNLRESTPLYGGRLLPATHHTSRELASLHRGCVGSPTEPDRPLGLIDRFGMVPVALAAAHRSGGLAALGVEVQDR
jgi:hypothetical protein